MNRVVRASLTLGVFAGLSVGGYLLLGAFWKVEAPKSTVVARKYEKIRGPAVAGIWYEKHPEDLTKQVDELLEQARSEPVENLRALICPHAGYAFSGPVAAEGYKQLIGRQFETVVVLGQSHRARFDGASIPDADAYETPLGLIPISAKAAELVGHEPFVLNAPCAEVERPQWNPFMDWRHSPIEIPPFGEDTAHTWEHSLEAQLPFLQRTLKEFELVPVLFGQEADPQAAARELEKIVDEKTLVVASSDLSHYLPHALAKRLDATCVEAICSLKIGAMRRQDACGKLPILTLMHLARSRGWKAKPLDVRNSGEVTGDSSRGVVGYAAIAFYDSVGLAPEEEVSAAPPGDRFAPDERKWLLALARRTVEAAVKGEAVPEVDAASLPEKFRQPKGCFVTLNKDGKLRGCIGSIFPEEPLYRAVIRRAQDAALHDLRFEPVTREELERIEVEVSVLTVPELLDFNTPEELLAKLRPHCDGVVLRLAYRESTYLPQVWEQLPDREAFLSTLSRKAGLSPDAWKHPMTTILVYQAEAFR